MPRTSQQDFLLSELAKVLTKKEIFPNSLPFLFVLFENFAVSRIFAHKTT